MTLYRIFLVDFKLWTADNLWSSLYITKYTMWTLDYSVYRFLQQSMKVVYVKINNGGTLTRVDSV